MFNNTKFKRKMRFRPRISCEGCARGEYKKMSDSQFLTIARELCCKHGLELISFNSEPFGVHIIELKATKDEFLKFIYGFVEECGEYIKCIQI